jgi:hypothetical protein
MPYRIEFWYFLQGRHLSVICNVLALKPRERERTKTAGRIKNQCRIKTKFIVCYAFKKQNKFLTVLMIRHLEHKKGERNERRTNHPYRTS